MNADGSNQKRLSEAEYRDEFPVFTPDGKHIIFSKRAVGIVMITIDGTNTKVLHGEGIYPTICK